MRYIKFLFVTMFFMFVGVNHAAADKCEPEMYMFGYAFSFNDSTLYVTPIQKIDNVWVKSRNGFVIERETYSGQFQSYFDNKDMKDMTCGISYSTKHKKLSKRYAKLIERYRKKMKNVEIVFLKETDFAFKSFVPLQIDDDTNASVQKKKSKKTKK